MKKREIKRFVTKEKETEGKIITVIFRKLGLIIWQSNIYIFHKSFGAPGSDGQKILSILESMRVSFCDEML